jgi:hypothetical protein
VLRDASSISCPLHPRHVVGDGKLTIKTDGLGTIAVEWDDVDRLTSGATYDIELATGDRLFGSLARSAARSADVARRRESDRWPSIASPREVERDPGEAATLYGNRCSGVPGCRARRHAVIRPDRIVLERINVWFRPNRDVFWSIHNTPAYTGTASSHGASARCPEGS